MIKDVLQAVLTREQQAEGLYLEELDDHTVGLFNSGGSQIAVWSSMGATVAEIRKEADIYLGKENEGA